MREEDVEIGRVAMKRGWVTQGQLNDCLSEAVASGGPDLAEILSRRGLIDPAQASEAREAAKWAAQERQGRVDEPSGVRPAQETIPPEVIAAAEDPKNHVGKFIRVREIGRGSMGTVWKAWDADAMQWRALKFLLFGDGDVLKNLVEQAQIAGRVKHPNLVRVYDCGEWSDGGRMIPYLVMDVVDGRNLEELRAQGITQERSAEIVRDAARAIAAAHEHGVLHLDITPRHVLIDANNGAHITDFGLAAPVGTIGPEDGSGASRIIEIQGTPAYLSPEQAVGRKIDIGARSDVYMLGATLYILLAGRPPFEAGDAVKTCIKVVREPLPKPSERHPGLSPDLERIVLRAMEKDPLKRYETAKLLADDLERYLQRSPILSDDQLRFTRGIAALHAGRMEETIHMFRELLRADSRGGDVIAGREAVLKEIREGEEGLSLAIQQQQKNYDVRSQRGILRLARAIMVTLDGGDPAEACKGSMDDFVRSCELRPQHASARVNRANVLTFSGRYARGSGKDVEAIFRMALEDLAAAAGFDPTASTAFHNRGIIHFYIAQSLKGDARVDALRRAVEDFASASGLEPTYSYMLKDLGVAKVALAKELLARGEKVKPLFMEAVDHLTQAVQLNAGLAGAWYERGHANFALKRFDLAVADWERTLSLDAARRSKVAPLLREARAQHEKRTRGIDP